MINFCFHGIGTPGRDLEPDEDQFWIGREHFEELLSVAQELPSVELSFDDGNASDFSIALPALVERGLTASFFVISGGSDIRDRFAWKTYGHSPRQG